MADTNFPDQWRAHALEGVGQPFVGEVGVGHGLTCQSYSLVRPRPAHFAHKIPQKSRVTSNAKPARRLCAPTPASIRNTPSHSIPSPSVTRAPGVARHGVSATGRSTHPAATY